MPEKPVSCANLFQKYHIQRNKVNSAGPLQPISLN